MSLLLVVILAIIQGLTEFLPVSSSAHLAIFGSFLGIKEKDALSFFIALHIGTLISLFCYFYKDIMDLMKGLFKMERGTLKFVLMMIITTIPTGIIGLSLKPVVEKALISPITSALLLLITAALLFLTRLFKEQKDTISTMNGWQALVIGIVQGIAVFPGISRSGSTISAGLLLGLKGEDAFKYSFLSCIPAIMGAALLDIKDMARTALVKDEILGASIAFIFGFAALFFLKKIVIKNWLHRFGYYCVLFSLITIIIIVFH